MALVTSQSTLPDFEYEHHTVILDNLDHGSDNTDFTLHLPTPLENIVQAQLIAASINTTGDAQRCIHIGIEELRSIFSQRGKKSLEDADTHLNGVFGTIICEHKLHASSAAQKAVLFRNEYPIIQQYYNPIRKLDRLTFNLDKQDGDAAACGDAVFIFKFICKKRNMSY
jgi:hypothetical protein|tara:strand:- start:74 stop:580 length:507 start_codon:yes stop_codon:yes gene_type:complete